jgi:alcohol-forming fatty acyl-CoA reductase
VITESLSGRTIAITGATGFLGTVIVERLLRSGGGCRVVCIVRPSRRFSAWERVRREIVRNDCFDRLRAELGDEFDTYIDEHLSAIAGDVSQEGLGLDEDGIKELAKCDTVIHSAAAVSFDSPLDVAVEINLLGPTRVADAIHQSGANAHLIAVSTAYVAGNRRGDAFEELITETWYSPDVDWRAEVTSGRRVLADAQNSSRQAEQLRKFWKTARRELGPAGTPLIAERSEKLREDWVKQRLVEQGKARAQSLGWPDVYAYTKALGERALLETRGDTAVSFVRPSIIESALEEPTPGWIRGFRMAEPIIIGVGKGLLKGFPGLPEGVLDVIPVDKVVAAICTIAAAGPNEQPGVYQIASGSRQPLKYRTLVDLTTEWYREHPLYDADGQPIIVERWDYPRRGKVQRQLNEAIRALTVAEHALQVLPLRGKPGDWAAKLEESRISAERARGYVDIYSAYTESEARFRIDRTLALYESLDDEDKKQFNFDPIDIDWRYYLHNIHLPSVVEQGRVRNKPVKKTSIDRAARARQTLLSPARQMAVFDFENTLMRSNVINHYAWLTSRNLSNYERVALAAKRLPRFPSLLAIERKDRGDFLRAFYRWYKGAPAEQTRQAGQDLFNEFVLGRIFPDGIQRVRDHKAAGHHTLLITGELDIVVEPLRELFDEIVCARMSEEDGVLTGELIEVPPVGEARALFVKNYADQHGFDLSECVAYADSSSDLPILDAVGHAVAVNPETRLAAIARRRGWFVEKWTSEGNAPLPASIVDRNEVATSA